MNISLQTFEFNVLPTNTYIIWDDTHEAAIIDPACQYADEKQTLARFLAAEQLQVKHILLTHFHFDHVFGVPFTEKLCGIRCQAHPADQWWAENNDKAIGAFGIPYPGELPSIGAPLADGDIISFGETTLLCIHTPGHSPGSVSFYCAEHSLCFVGDTLFASGGMGRTDLHGGNYPELQHSVRTRLFTLPDETIIYPGHGPSSTLRNERWYHNL